MPPLFVCIIAHCSSHNSNLILLADDKQKPITPSKSLSPFHIRFFFIEISFKKIKFLCFSIDEIFKELYTNRWTIQKHLDFDVFMITLVVNQNYMTEATNEYVITGNSALMRCVIPSFVSDFISLQNWQDEKGNVMVPSSTNNYGRQQQKSVACHLQLSNLHKP